MKTKRIAAGLALVVTSLFIASFVLTTGCQQSEKATQINLDFKKWYAIGEAEGSTMEKAIEAADSTAFALLAEKLNVKVDEIKNPSTHTRYISPTQTRTERVGRRRIVTTYYVARVEVRAPQDVNPKQL